MIVLIAIFLITIVSAFGMLLFRAWQIRTARVQVEALNEESLMPDVSFRHVEKYALYATKHVVQSIILFTAKWWFVGTTRTKKWLAEKWPRVHRIFEKKQKSADSEMKPSFFKKAVIESKTKIKRIKEKVKREHGIEEIPAMPEQREVLSENQNTPE